MHIQEDFTQLSIFILSSSQVELVATDSRFLCIALASAGQSSTFGNVAVNDFLSDAYFAGLCRK